MEGAGASLSILAFWIAVGIVWYFASRNRQRRLARKREVERLLSQWLDQERRNGADPVALLEQIPLKRAELERLVD